MQPQRCLFCGQNTVICVQKEEPSALSKLLFSQDNAPQVTNKETARQYTCSNCGLIFTQQEIDKDTERLNRNEFYQTRSIPTISSPKKRLSPKPNKRSKNIFGTAKAMTVKTHLHPEDWSSVTLFRKIPATKFSTCFSAAGILFSTLWNS